MRLWPLILALAPLTGCGPVPQVSSGAEYLAARPEYSAANGTDLDKAVRHAADVEPLLRFPTKLGLARISGGQFVPVPPREADAWIAFAKTHSEYGEFVPISPLVADLAMAAEGYHNTYGSSAIIPIRLAAARQHVDAVLVYTVAGNSTDKMSPLSVMDLTIIGAYLVPSRSVAGTAVASILLFDVRNGYPYGTLSATAVQTSFVPNAGSTEQSQNLQVDAQVEALGKLTGEADKLLIGLRETLAAKEAASPHSPTIKAVTASKVPAKL
jgi:hypothetical protein